MNEQENLYFLNTSCVFANASFSENPAISDARIVTHSSLLTAAVDGVKLDYLKNIFVYALEIICRMANL